MTSPSAAAAARPEADPAAGEHVPRVLGQPLEKLPEDLYIPPDALEVFLEAFEGPLDLLLYLIRKQNLDILDIPVLQITRQYMQYIELMQGLKLELAAEYLVMAAWLAEIKSRVLLPRTPDVEEEEVQDPRLELVRRLQEYERFKTAAEALDALPRVGREIMVADLAPEATIQRERALPKPELRELLLAFQSVMNRAELFTQHAIAREPLSVRDRMSRVLGRLQDGPARFEELFDPAEGRAGIVVALLAILELAKAAMLDVQQDTAFAVLVVRVPKAMDAGELS